MRLDRPFRAKRLRHGRLLPITTGRSRSTERRRCLYARHGYTDVTFPEARRLSSRLSLLSLPRLPEAWRVALAVGCGIALLGGLGAADLFLTRLPAYDLDAERTVPTAFSALLLLAAGVLAWQVGGARSSGYSKCWRIMGAFFVFMAFDEVLAIHEKVSAPVTGMSWQVFYAPVVLCAAIGWLVILRRLPSTRARILWIGGAAAWFVSQVIEQVQWDGDRLVHPWTFIPEEMLEMTGSLLWGLAILLALRQLRADSGRDAVEPRTRRRVSPVRTVGRRARGHGSDRLGTRTSRPGAR